MSRDCHLPCPALPCRLPCAPPCRWTTPPLNPAGCITGYRVMTYDGNTGASIGSSFVQASSMQDPVKTEVVLQPGKKTTIK